MDKTEVFRADQTGEPCLSAFHAYGHIDDFPLKRRMRLGRTGSREQADIQVPVPAVSGIHGEFGSAEGHWFYRDLGSTNGTRINGSALSGIHELMDGDIITVVPRDEEQGEPVFAGIFIRLKEGETILWRKTQMKPDMEPIRGGRLRTLDVVRMGRSFFVVTDGVLWEGEIRSKKETAAEARREVLERKNPEPAPAVRKAIASNPRKEFPGGSRLVIDIDERSVWKNFKKRVLLRNIHLSIDPGDMVLILGGSGAGKSTFMKSVMGYDKAEGGIRYGDKDVYDDYETMKYEIGYVPQQDLVRLSDSVGDTLMAAARLRMPGNSSIAEQTRRVEWLLDILGLLEEKDNLIGSISGGQKKRVSIGIELAADPALFFLDEPDSGLDGVMARGLMEKLRVIADLGKIVLVITHTPDRAADLFTKVIVLGKTLDNVGHMIFYGSPEEALGFFETDKLENIVHRINRPSEGGEGLADYFYNRFLTLSREARHGE